MTLHATAKEFVPSASAKEFVPSTATLKATAGSWAPDASKKEKSSEEKKAPADAKVDAKEAPKASPAQAPPAPAPKVAAWGSKPSEAIKKAAPIKPQQKPASQTQQPQQQQRSNSNRSSATNKGGDWKRGEKSKPSTGGSNTGSWARAAAKPGPTNNNDGGNNRRQSQSRGNNKGGDDGGNEDKSWSRGKVLPTELLVPGEGSTDAEKAVKRISVMDILSIRLSSLGAPSSWEPPEACHWNTPTRISEIEETHKAERMGGDVSKQERRRKKENPNDTAPPLEDCKPLEVNEETRWKAKVFDGKDNKADDEGEESKEDILRRAMLILNKLSLTKFDKLSDDFINCGIGRDIDCLTGAVGLIVNKAQEEQHFSSMYAGLCLKLSNTPMEGIDDGTKKGKKFKKILLERCQKEFETDAATKVKEATKDITDEEEIEYHTNLIKKHYLGHMRFIGELYNGDLISIKIMLFCLPSLLQGESDNSGDVDEEKIECFAKLMTVIGSSLEQQSEAMKSVGKTDAAENLADCWKTVEIMAGKRQGDGPKVSNRIKFMLQDLLETKAKGWVTRRKEETAKTIAQIHKEVAKEERAAKRSASSASLRSKGSMRRGASSGDVRVRDKAMNKPQVDEDGFVSVAKSKTVHRSVSMTAMDNQGIQGSQKYSTRGSTVARKSSQSKFAVLNEGGSNKKESRSKPAEETKPKVNYPSPEECSEKAKNILKEYFVGGDTSDAVLSIDELVGVGNDGSVARGAKVVESAVLLVLERKEEDIEKFLRVYLQCAKENKIEGKSFVLGLNDPLEFLSDVAIDAPLAVPHLANIVAQLVKAKIIPFNFLLNSPDYFRTDQNAATFGAKVMKKIGEDALKSDDFIEVIQQLMTEEDKTKYSSANELITAA